MGFEALSKKHTFHYTGGEQSFTVPVGVKWITVVALGAAGGGHAGGRGGRVFAQLPVAPGERLAVFVGGTTSNGSGGFNGGGPAALNYSYDNVFGGGGESDIRKGGIGLGDRVLIAGGGGGQGGPGYYGWGGGGKGGGVTAGAGRSGFGLGGLAGGGGGGGGQHRGGSGGQPGKGVYGYGLGGEEGGLFQGGFGGLGEFGINGGGGGGGGCYGGGGGGGGGWTFGNKYGGGGGGGGGSSYVEHTARRIQSSQGWKTATHNGVVVLSW